MPASRGGVYPVPQKAPCVTVGMNVPTSLYGKRPKATDVSPWYGVYIESIDVEGFYQFHQVGSVKTQRLGCGGAISLGVGESLYDQLTSIGLYRFMV